MCKGGLWKALHTQHYPLHRGAWRVSWVVGGCNLLATKPGRHGRYGLSYTRNSVEWVVLSMGYHECREFFSVHIVRKMAQDLGELWQHCGVIPILLGCFFCVFLTNMHLFSSQKLSCDLFFFHCSFPYKRGGKGGQGEAKEKMHGLQSIKVWNFVHNHKEQTLVSENVT